MLSRSWGEKCKSVIVIGTDLSLAVPLRVPSQVLRSPDKDDMRHPLSNRHKGSLLRNALPRMGVLEKNTLPEPL